MATIYEEFLAIKAQLGKSSKTVDPIEQRFLELDASPAGERGQIDQGEYDALLKIITVRVQTLNTEIKAKQIIAKIKSERREANIRSKT